MRTLLIRLHRWLHKIDPCDCQKPVFLNFDDERGNVTYGEFPPGLTLK